MYSWKTVYETKVICRYHFFYLPDEKSQWYFGKETNNFYSQPEQYLNWNKSINIINWWNRIWRSRWIGALRTLSSKNTEIINGRIHTYFKIIFRFNVLSISHGGHVYITDLTQCIRSISRHCADYWVIRVWRWRSRCIHLTRHPTFYVMLRWFKH